MAGFQNILVVSTQSGKDTAGIEKAIELGHPAETRIHLLRILPELSVRERIRQFFSGEPVQTRQHRMELQQLAASMQDQYHSLQAISNVLFYQHTGNAIRRYLHQHKIDLIIENLGDTGSVTHFPETFITRSGVPLLALRHDESRPATRSLLLPVTGVVSYKKIQAAIEITQKTGAQVHIVTVLNSSKASMKIQADAFYQTYKYFCEYGLSPQYRVLTGNNRSELVLHYASQVKAGMLMLQTNPVNRVESVKRKLQNLMHPGKAFQVLTMRLLKPSVAQ
jgi:hypothetical protein